MSLLFTLSICTVPPIPHLDTSDDELIFHSLQLANYSNTRKSAPLLFSLPHDSISSSLVPMPRSLYWGKVHHKVHQPGQEKLTKEGTRLKSQFIWRRRRTHRSAKEASARIKKSRRTLVRVRATYYLCSASSFMEVFRLDHMIKVQMCNSSHMATLLPSISTYSSPKWFSSMAKTGAPAHMLCDSNHQGELNL